MTKIQEEMTLTFNKPINIGTADEPLLFEKVTLREPEAFELDMASRELTSVGGVIKLIHLVGKIPHAAAKKVGARDLNRASAFFTSFNVGPEAAADGPN